MRSLKFVSAVFALGLAMGPVLAHELSGTWKFEKSAEYTGNVKIVRAPELQLFQIVNGRMMHPKCDVSVDFEKTELDYSELFQDNEKANITSAALDKFLRKAFSVNFADMKHYYRAPASECNLTFHDLLVTKDRILSAQGGTVFYSFSRAKTPEIKNAAALGIEGRKLTQLPYDSNTFITLCRKRMPLNRGVIETTEQCAPVYYPYVATKKDTDRLAKLIGSHDYSKRGAIGAKGYDNPVARNLNPVYFILPPLNDVLVVAVEDIQQGERFNRDGINGVYLAIKAGAVTDQLNAGCSLNEQYACVDGDGKKMYQLLDTGKFQKVQ